jgi:phage anti-repressor protein
MLTIDEQKQVKDWLQDELDGVAFPVDFDIAWVMAGYARKDHAKRRLTNQSSYLVKDEDYKIDHGDVLLPQSGESTILGRSSDRIVMTCDAFKHFCLMAQTSKGREIRQYFINVEKNWNHDLMQDEIDALYECLDDLESETKQCESPKKFRVNHQNVSNTSVYTLVCVVGDGQFVELMSYTLPPEIYNEPEFERYSLLKGAAMANFYAFVHLLNEMSKDFTPCLDGVIYRYASLGRSK